MSTSAPHYPVRARIALQLQQAWARAARSTHCTSHARVERRWELSVSDCSLFPSSFPLPSFPPSANALALSSFRPSGKFRSATDYEYIENYRDNEAGSRSSLLQRRQRASARQRWWTRGPRKTGKQQRASGREGGIGWRKGKTGTQVREGWVPGLEERAAPRA